MTMIARFLPQYPKRVDVTNGLTKREANGVLTLGFDYVNSEFGAELQQAVDTSAENASSTAADRAAVAADAAEAAASAAEAAVAAQATDPTFKTVIEASAATVPATKTAILTAGYLKVGIGGARYIRVSTEPDHPGKLRSTDRYMPDGTTNIANGGWWALSEPVVTQYMFGAVGDGVADDTIALQNLLTYGEFFKTFTNTSINIQAAFGDHKITDTLVVMSGCDLSAMTLLVDAATLAKAMRIGGNTGYSDLIYQHVVIRTPIIINTAKVYPNNFGIKVTGWTGFQTSVGLEIANIQDAHIYVNHITGFGRNLWMSAYNQGNAYNQIFLAQLGNGFYNLALEPGNSGGWVNENTFYGGHLYHESSEGTGIVGVREIYIDGTNAGIGGVPNNNIFFKPSVEGDVPDYQVQIRGAYNRIVQARWESHPPRVLFFAAAAGETLKNVIDGGFNCENIQITSSALATGNTLIAPSIQKISGGPTALMLKSDTGDTISEAHVMGFDATLNLLSLTSTSSSWVYKLYTGALVGKRVNDAYGRVSVDFVFGKVLFGSGTAAPAYGIQGFGTSLGVTTHLLPITDNTYTNGASDYRWSVVYAGSGTINTSDAREKEWRGGLNDAELRVATRLSKLIGVYRWKEAVAKKGDAARLHVGVTAQDVQGAFAAEGLDGFCYGVLCYDEWGARPEELDADGNVVMPARAAGNRYGVRYDELWALIAAGIEARLSALE